MPYNLVYSPVRFYCYFEGALNWNDVFAVTRELYGNDKLNSIQEVLLEFSEVSQIDLGQNSMKELVYLDIRAHGYNPSIKFAIVAKSPDGLELAKTYIRYAKQLNIPWQYKIFDRVDSANIWLKGSTVPKNEYKTQYY